MMRVGLPILTGVWSLVGLSLLTAGLSAWSNIDWQNSNEREKREDLGAYGTECQTSSKVGSV
jgi:hypothetical protein